MDLRRAWGPSALQGRSEPDISVSQRRLRSAARLAPALSAALANSGNARAADIANVSISDSDTSTLLLLLLLMFGVLTAVLHIAGRHRWTKRERELANELAHTHAQLERANLFLASEPQIVVAWNGPNAKPRFEGDLALIGDVPAPERALAFSAWLEPAAAAKAKDNVRRLLERGESFTLPAPASKAAISRSSAAPSPATRS